MAGTDAAVGSLTPLGLNKWWNMYLSAFEVGTGCKASSHSTCLSVVSDNARPDGQARRSSTFTLPSCKTSRGVLMNEVAISYCSVKCVLNCMCQRERERERGVRSGCYKRQDELEKDGKADLHRCCACEDSQEKEKENGGAYTWRCGCAEKKVYVLNS